MHTGYDAHKRDVGLTKKGISKAQTTADEAASKADEAASKADEALSKAEAVLSPTTIWEGTLSDGGSVTLTDEQAELAKQYTLFAIYNSSNNFPALGSWSKSASGGQGWILATCSYVNSTWPTVEDLELQIDGTSMTAWAKYQNADGGSNYASRTITKLVGIA